MMNIGPPHNHVENLWRHFWAQKMRDVGGKSLLPLNPMETNGELIAPSLPQPEPEQKSRYRTASLRKDILDKLSQYQKYIKRLKKYDPDAYTMYRRIGAYVLDEVNEASRVEIEKSFLKLLPSFGAVAIGIGDADTDPTKKYGPDDPIIHVRFAYFMKLERPGFDIQRANTGVTYRCRLYYDDTVGVPMVEVLKRTEYGFHIDIVLNILDDGTVLALRTLRMKAQHMYHKTRGWDGRKTSTVVHHRWKYPPIGNKPNDNHAEIAVTVFTLLANFWLNGAQSSMIRVTATKDKIVMPFVVDVLRTPQFFKDRDKVLLNGKQRPIFHVVRPHRRGDAYVKLHFAGLRRFAWNGYQVQITVPGKEHVDPAEFDGGALEDVDDEELAARTDLVDFAYVAEKIADAIGAPAKEAK